MNKENRLLDTISEIDEKLLTEHYENGGKIKSGIKWKVILSSAACLMLLVGVLIWQNTGDSPTELTNDGDKNVLMVDTSLDTFKAKDETEGNKSPSLTDTDKNEPRDDTKDNETTDSVKDTEAVTDSPAPIDYSAVLYLGNGSAISSTELASENRPWSDGNISIYYADLLEENKVYAMEVNGLSYRKTEEIYARIYALEWDTSEKVLPIEDKMNEYLRNGGSWDDSEYIAMKEEIDGYIKIRNEKRDELLSQNPSKQMTYDFLSANGIEYKVITVILKDDTEEREWGKHTVAFVTKSQIESLTAPEDLGIHFTPADAYLNDTDGDGIVYIDGAFTVEE